MRRRSHACPSQVVLPAKYRRVTVPMARNTATTTMSATHVQVGGRWNAVRP